MGISSIPHPAVLLAFADGASLQQNRDCPALQTANGASLIFPRQHSTELNPA
jgi:hypothetical protein